MHRDHFGEVRYAAKREHFNVGVDGSVDVIVRYRYISSDGIDWNFDYILWSQPRAFGAKVYAERRSIRRHECTMAGAFASFLPLDCVSLPLLLGDLRTRACGSNSRRRRRVFRRGILPPLRQTNVPEIERLLQRAERNAVRRAVRSALPGLRRVSHFAVDRELRIVSARTFRAGVFDCTRKLRGDGLRAMLRRARSPLVVRRRRLRE